MPQGHLDETLGRAQRAFAGKFGRAPTLAAAAPGRVNLIGEHTDYNGGFVLPIAIDRVCVAVAAPAADPGVSRIYAADLDQLSRLDFGSPIALGRTGDVGDIQGGAGVVVRGSPLSYVAGVAAGFQRLGAAGFVPLPNLDIAIASSVPIGSGLSSSAAIEVATATLLEAALGRRMEPKAKALLCQRAEHEFAGVPCGIMDQFISVMGQEDHALLIDCRSQTAEAIPMPAADRVAVVVIDSGVHHALAAGEYAKRRVSCAAAAAKLGVKELRDATPLPDGAGLSGEELRRARHVVTENARALAAAVALRGGNLAEMGRLMGESHASLRDDFEVSCEELDTLVELAAGCSGVHGARMTGAGFGGCIVALAVPGAVEALRHAVLPEYKRRHGRAATVFVCTAGGGARTLS